MEAKLTRSHFAARHGSVAQHGRRLDRFLVLRAETRLVSVGPDLDHPEGPAGKERKRKRRAQDLAPSLAVRSVKDHQIIALLRIHPHGRCVSRLGVWLRPVP